MNVAMSDWKTAALLGFGFANGIAMCIALMVWSTRHHRNRRPGLLFIPLAAVLAIETFILFDFPAVVPRSSVTLAVALLTPVLTVGWYLYLRLCQSIPNFLNHRLKRFKSDQG